MVKMYRSNIRPIIIAGSIFAILWSLASGVSSFRNVPVFDNNHETKLGIFYIIIGALYMGVMAIEAFGIFATVTRRLTAVRTYSYLSVIVAVLIGAAGLIQTIIHFAFKNDIITVCSTVNTGDHVFFTGFFGPVDGGVLTPEGAEDWCRRQFDHDSFSNIVAFLVTTFIATVFTLFVFAYLRQLSDPTSIANVQREPVRMNAYPARYNPPYNPSYNQYQAPNGPPPVMSSDAFVPPYEGSEGRPPNYEGGNYRGGFADHKDDPFWDGHSAQI